VQVEALLDTNVLVYAFAADRDARHEVAARLVGEGFERGCFAITTQVMKELYVTVTRKVATPLTESEAVAVLRALLSWPVVTSTPAMVVAAAEASSRWRISLWDAAIIEAARSAGCRLVLSEDLKNGMDYGGVTVRNPFLA
jgi:predicted nucleic acid-binding protein